MIIFLLDLAAEVYVERKYGVHRDEDATGAFIQGKHHCPQSEEEPYGQEKVPSPTQTTPT
jgi:zinc transporter 1/2/3